jgi:D-glycerate 3-kinase
MHWPPKQQFLSDARLAALAERCRAAFVRECEAMRIDNDLSAQLESLYLPLAAWLQARRAGGQPTRVIGVSGAQGSGKSTFCRLLALVFREAFAETAVTLSIDDFYETRERRAELARELHPLFATRGVPGTHDVALALSTIRGLTAAHREQPVPLPEFDKATDTRRPPEQWHCHRGPADSVLFEGWCVGALPQSEEALVEPVNALEREEDAHGVWRRTVNERLRGEYRQLFALIDVLILLRVQGMHQVFEWRRLQEHKLAAAVAARPGNGSTRIMSDAEVDRFVMHYERLTRHILAEMPARADIVFDLDSSHSAARVHINNPLGEPI